MNGGQGADRTLGTRLAAVADAALALLLSLVTIDIALPRHGGEPAREARPDSDTSADERSGGGTPAR